MFGRIGQLNARDATFNQTGGHQFNIDRFDRTFPIHCRLTLITPAISSLEEAINAYRRFAQHDHTRAGSHRRETAPPMIGRIDRLEASNSTFNSVGGNQVNVGSRHQFGAYPPAPPYYR